MGRRVRTQEVPMKASAARLARAGVNALEAAYDCQLLAIIAQDDNGVYVTLRPGSERTVAEGLYDLNWTEVFAEALQQYPT